MSLVVITGRDPVIHAFFRTAPDNGTDVDGRIKAGRDDYRWYEHLH